MSCSHSAGFGVRMSGQPHRCGEFTVFRRLAPAIVLLAALAPQFAHAQINIDEGKTPAHIFSSDCAVCHKSTRGLANGRGSSELAGFLSEHYTSSREEASALAAYVLAGGGDKGTPAPAHQPKPVPDQPTASAEDPKESNHQARRPVKPEEQLPPSAKLKRPGRETPPPKPVVAEQHPVDEPGDAISTAPATLGPPNRAAPGAKRGRPTPHEAQSPERGPATALAVPSPAAISPQEAPAPPSAEAPADAPPADSPPVPRDDIPD
jgi:hypothetical protein